jgi:hypothetical protein
LDFFIITFQHYTETLTKILFVSQSSQERRGGKESQRRDYTQNHQHWSAIYENIFLLTLVKYLSITDILYYIYLDKVGGPDLKSFVRQFPATSEGIVIFHKDIANMK